MTSEVKIEDDEEISLRHRNSSKTHRRTATVKISQSEIEIESVTAAVEEAMIMIDSENNANTTC